MLEKRLERQERLCQIRLEVLEELRRKIRSFCGRQVVVWTRYTQPIQGTFVFLSMVTPFILFIVDQEGRPHMINWAETVEVESKEKFKIP